VTSPGRGGVIGVGLAWAARWSARLLLVAAGIWLLGFLVGALWTVVFPTLLAIVLATVFWPPAAFLRRHRFAPALASGVVVVVGILVIGVLITLVGTAVAGSLPQIVASVVTGVQSVRTWISGPPLNLADSQLTALVQQVTTRIQESVSTIATGVLTGVGSIASGVITFVLVLILTFLFVKDGPKFLPWVHKVTGPSAGGHLAEVLRRIWVTVGSFIRQQAVVSLVDAVLIGAGLLIVGVPLALPLAVLTFLGGFIPIIGAFVAGAVAVLVALVNNGFAAGITVLIIVVVVQQIEGNVLQPVLQSRGLGLHAAVVLLAITAGSTLYGIAGAFLAVPVTAAFAVVLRYLGEQIDERTPPDPEPDPDLTAEHDPELGSAP
jgi:predicted PurR-regulated permease PerM